MALIVAVATALSTFLGGLFAIRFRDHLHLILGFSAGAVIGVAFFDLLPESFELAEKAYDIRTITLLLAAGFAFFLLLDRSFSLHLHTRENCHNASHSGSLAATALCFHSLLDGLGIGLAFQVSSHLGWIVAVAVLAHDFSDGINTVSVILRDQGRSRQAFAWLVADSVAPALGVVITFGFTVSTPILGLLLAVFCGFFFYIGASDLIPESHHRHPAFATTAMTLLGIAVLFVAIRLAG